MNDIRPPRRSVQPIAPRQPPAPLTPAQRQPSKQPSTALDHRISPPAAEPLLEAHNEPTTPAPAPTTSNAPSPKQPPRRKWSLIVLCAILVISLIGALAGYLWYQQALTPVSSDPNAAKQRVTIESGSTPSQIGDLLVDKQLIRSKQAFDIHTRLTDTINNLQAGSYRLSPNESTPEIVKHLISGNVDQFDITFFPGATLTDTVTKTEAKKVDVTTILKRAGFEEAEITAALKKTYDHPVFATKPAGTDLEGYVYGETYSFSSSASVENVLVRTFDELYEQIKDNDLEAGFKAQGLTLYEGITMASIIQREVPLPDDQKQVAQVFLKRYREGMVLGSDITAYYGADKVGVDRTVAVDTPYNTRIHAGLPPTPIAAPGLSALLATASPAQGDYVYFLSGDDEVTYFARTNEDHEANIKNHCAVKCAIP